MFTHNTGFLSWNRNKIIATILILLILMISSSEPELHRRKRYFLTYHKEVELIEEPVCNITVVPAGTRFQTNEKITCPGMDFVRCYLSKCKVDAAAMERHLVASITCQYEELTFTNGRTYASAPTVVSGRDGVYKLSGGDIVRINCNYMDYEGKGHTWLGFGWGLNSTDTDSSEDVENAINVLMIGFASLSQNVFIRRMPKSFEYLQNTLGATFLNGYNVVSNSTIGDLLPLLTGKSEPELSRSDDEEAFLFHKVKKYAYRTAVFENMPREHTRNRFYRGFKVHPADHVGLPMNHLARKVQVNKFCIGDTPFYKVIINATAQFFKWDDGARFSFTFIADFRNDDINKIGNADETLTALLHGLKKSGRFYDTLLVVFGERGPRYFNGIASYEDELEERLPLMAIRLPEALKKRRPGAQAALQGNIDALITPYDIHATILDVLDLRAHWNTYRVPGVNYRRGLTLLGPIPRDRRCKEADIDPYLCSCLNWEPVGISDANYKRVAQVLVDALNGLTEFQRSSCALRHLKSIDWVIKQTVNQKIFEKRYSKLSQVLEVQRDRLNNTISNFGSYQVQLIVSPGHAVFRATVTYDSLTGEFNADINHIHRINPSKNEIHCLNASYPRLNQYCYCRYNYVNI